MPWKIRPYEDRDFFDYVATLEKTWPMSREEAIESIRARLKSPKQKEEHIWVAEIKGKAVGFILVGVEDNSLLIDWFDVHPDFQGRGLGASLLKKAEQIAQEKRLPSIVTYTAVTNTRMLRFSEKNGFTVTKRLGEFWGKDTSDAFLLTRKVKF